MQHASLDAFAITITGRRSHNEDAILARADLGLFVVADGMGGYEGGEVASAIAVDAIGGLVRHTAGGDNVSWPFPIDATRTPDENELAVAIRIAGARIAAQRTGALGQMGATVAALRFARGHAAVAHVGDSRVYRLRDGALEQLTTDHSLAAELTAAGTPPGEGFAWRHVVTRALGAERSDPDVQWLAARDGDRYLVCSDGLHDELAPAAIAAALALPVEAACRALVAAALAAGSRDNISAIVVGYASSVSSATSSASS